MERKIAKHLLDIGSVFLRPDKPFIWASGIESPIYCDNRLILSYPEVRKDVEEGLAELIKKEYLECQGVFGTSTAGIAHAAILSEILRLPMGYVRASAKDHGRTNQIEGRVVEGSKVVVVEDLISTAGSCIDVVNVLRNEKCNVLGIVSIFTYGMKKGLDNLEKNNVKNISLCNLDVLVEVAVEYGFIKEIDVNKIIAFRENSSDLIWKSM